MLPAQVTQRNLIGVLVAGFAAVIILLLTAGFVGIRNIRSIRQNAARLAREQRVTNGLLQELRRQQAGLGEVFSLLAGDPDSVDSDKILSQLTDTAREIGRIAEAGSETPQADLWQQLRNASDGFSNEARRLLSIEEPESFASYDLFRRHEEVISTIGKLMEASYQNALAAQTQITQRSEGLLRESVFLLGACLLLAIFFTFATVRIATDLVRKMEWQTGELSRVSWHMLEDQETTARRFSHELHDELGQSLSAVKANLAALGGEAGAERLRDCMHVVDEAIGNVRQLSQLLRPTILDDFGLEAGLRWLVEGFQKRTGIPVDFHSGLEGARLADETETHLFRIAQEALTNIARHSGATRATMDLQLRDSEIRLNIWDNGQGLPGNAIASGGLGLIGMRARARSTGGDVTFGSREGKGVAIEVRVPASRATHESKDPHPVS